MKGVYDLIMHDTSKLRTFIRKVEGQVFFMEVFNDTLPP